MAIDHLKYIVFIFFLPSKITATEPLTLERAINKAVAAHPEVSAAQSNLEAERANVSFSQSPRDPMFGFMYEQNQNFMQQQMGPMTSLSLSQDIEFPAKYYFRGRVQENRATLAVEMLREAKLTLRRKVVTVYFQLYANQHIKDLIDAQKDTLRQVARIAESRHAIGAVTQQDEMKAHVEQTAIENERFGALQEEEALQAKLASLLGESGSERFSLPDGGLQVPEARLPADIADVVLANSRRVKKGEVLLEESKLQKKLALFDYAPDFRLSARTVVGANRPDNNFVVSLDATIPLWFFMRQTPEVSAASARSREAQFTLQGIRRGLIEQANEIASKIRAKDKVIKVFKTTFIPQAESTLNASQAAYRAGKSSFLELLDSARTIFSIRETYYRHIAEYVEQLALLEELAGTSLSSLPFGDAS